MDHSQKTLIVPVDFYDSYSEQMKKKEKMKLQEEREKERRFYYVRVVNVDKVHEKLRRSEEEEMEALSPVGRKKQQRRSNRISERMSKIFQQNPYKNESELKIEFKIAEAQSDTRIKLGVDGKMSNQERKIKKEESHMLSFNDNEHMEVKIYQTFPDLGDDNEPLTKKQSVMLESDENYNIGYMKVLLTPFIEEPHTRHQVKLNMRFINKAGRLDVHHKHDKKTMDIAAIVTIQVYFHLKFQAKLRIVPLEAHLKNNPAQLGLLRPKIYFSLNKKVKKSVAVDNGGIHPRWNHEAAKRQEDLRQIRRNMHEEEGRVSKKEMENYLSEEEKEALFNIFTFDLTSVRHLLKLQVLNFPLFGKDPEVIGETQILLEAKNFFRNPGKSFYHTGRDALKLYCWKLSANKKLKERVQAGWISVSSQFVYDVKELRREIDSESQDDEQKDSDSIHSL